ncbi:MULTISPECIES: acyl-homoserine-lactone synthase [Rhizobium]|uniref:Acyl-homoserine-lactone synthase n=2 Tax=Rhizobium TaxID=379 RepID=A0A387G4D7_9HYPH|nr:MULTISPECIES: acyl-homoserine-lactone synthase [Rhizobium]AYG64215.1 GNAT family N-acetyltransferase [Rhizobium jaguaris]MDL2403958.1 acyl-homoserine-lactone synthase [Rhizobium mayense]
MEKIWRFRHQQFVERFGWEALRRSDGREIDQFDHEQALHLVLFCEDAVVGYSRLLPTTEPHLLSDIYPHIMNGQAWPRAPEIYEWTRCVAAEGAGLINHIPASHVLMTGVMEFCLVAGITSLIVETHPKLVDLLISTGWEVTKLSLPSVLGQELIMPIQAKPSLCGLMQHHRLYSIEASTLSLEPELRNPLRPEVTLGHLPFLARARVRPTHKNNEAYLADREVSSC